MARGGVYEIRNTVTGRVYIGSSYYIKRRIWDHRTCLRSGRGSNPLLQADWDKYGESAFTMTVLEEVEGSPDDDVMYFLKLGCAERDRFFQAKAVGDVYNIVTPTSPWRVVS